jgi:pantoate--beta-alanine ligase
MTTPTGGAAAGRSTAGTGLATPVVTTKADLAAARAALDRGGPVAVVMTMGALHPGHAALIRAARRTASAVIVTIFVNPLQFAPTEDLDRYPRTLEADLLVCAEEGVDLVFAPTAAEMYPAGRPAVTVVAGELGERLEGRSRPGFFHGVLTVVLKLLQLTRPDLAYFGEKDYQQLTVVRRMVADLDLPVDIIGVATVREPDGLALSSRNAYLSVADRERALVLSRALRAGAAAGPAGPDAVVAAARTALLDVPGAVPVRGAVPGGAVPGGAVPGGADPGAVPGGAELDYLELTGPSLGPVPRIGEARLLVAARVGGTRLIDNCSVLLG